MNKVVRQSQWAEVRDEWKRQHPRMELHHVFGRHGRRLACRRFFHPLTPAEHRGPGYGKITRDLRDQYWKFASEMAEANLQNMDICSCWWKACIYANSSCPLFRRATKLDARELEIAN